MNANRNFFDAYIECALWSSTDDKDEPLDRNYYWRDISAETIAKMQADCDLFQRDNSVLLNRYYEEIPNGRNASGEWTPDAQAGHDFWLSRNGHGAGFFDRDVNRELRDELQKQAESFGYCELYIGDDGQVYA